MDNTWLDLVESRRHANQRVVVDQDWEDIVDLLRGLTAENAKLRGYACDAMASLKLCGEVFSDE